MSTTEPSRGGRQPDRPGGGMPRPATPMVAIVIAAVAGLLGLLILKDVKDDGSGGGGSTKPAKTTTPASTIPESTVAPTTTPPLIRQGATVVVANASGIDGAAGNLTTALKTRNYVTGKPVTATVKADATVIMAKAGDTGAAAVARTLMLEMGLSGAIQPLTDSAPVKAGDLAGATVLVVLGPDKANQSLLPLGGDSTATTTPGTGTTSPKTTTTKPKTTTTKPKTTTTVKKTSTTGG